MILKRMLVLLPLKTKSLNVKNTVYYKVVLVKRFLAIHFKKSNYSEKFFGGSIENNFAFEKHINELCESVKKTIQNYMLLQNMLNL